MDDYGKLSHAELVAKVAELDILVKTLTEEKDGQELLKFPWIGNLGSWYFYYQTRRVVCNIHKILALGYTQAEIPDPLNFEFFTEKVHPDDFEPMMENMRQHVRGNSPAYEFTYRIKTKTGKWKWFYDRGTITKRDEAGNPELVAGIVFDVTEQKRMEQLLVAQNEQLSEMTKNDYLTGIYNRKALHETLAYELRRVERNKSALSVVLLDIDDFKSINDTYGHLIGDEVLTKVAEVLKSSTRTTDIIGRFGGEEFLVILPDCNLANGMMIAEKIRADIQDAEFPAGLNVTISAGVNEYENSWVDHLLQGADRAMLAAKRNGKNQVAAAGNAG